MPWLTTSPPESRPPAALRPRRGAELSPYSVPRRSGRGESQTRPYQRFPPPQCDTHPAPVDALEYAGTLLLLWLALSGIGGLALGALGWFTGLALILITGILLAMVLLLGIRSAPTRVPSGALVSLGLLLALFATLVWPPAEFILGGLDTGAYFTTGAGLARSGSFSQADPFLSSAGPEARAAFAASNGPRQPYLLPGFAFPSDGGVIVPQFGMLLSLWIGVGTLVGGPLGGLAVAPIIGALALALFYLLVRRAWGAGVGLAAALLLATNGVQVWHAQQTLSEELVQVFLFGGLLVGLLALRERRPLYAATAGLLLAALPLVKTEALVLSPLALGAVGLALRTPSPPAPLPQGARGEGSPSPFVGSGADRLQTEARDLVDQREPPHLRLRATPLPMPGEGRVGTSPSPLVGEGVRGWGARPFAVSALGAFIAGAALGGFSSIAHYATTARLYAWEQIAYAPWYPALGAAVLILGLIWFVTVRGARPLDWPSRWGAKGSILVFALAVVVSGAGLLVLPGLPFPVDLLRALYLGTFLTFADLAVVGLGLLALLLVRPLPRLSGGQATVLTVLLLASVLYLAIYAYYVAAQDRLPLYMWSTRRLLPAVIPLLAIIEALILASAVRTLALASARGPALVAAAALLSLSHAPSLEPFLDHREYRGALEQIADLDARLPGDAVALFVPDDAGIRLATPLRFLYGRESYVLWNGEQAPAGVGELRDWAAAQGREVWYVAATPHPGSRLLLARGAQVEGRVSLALPELERTSRGRPAGGTSFRSDLTLFRLLSSSLPETLPVGVDVGAEDAVAYALLRDGWYGREIEPGGPTYRWTGHTASIAFPRGLTGPASILFHLGTTDRPEGAPPARTTVLCGSREVGTLEPGPGFPAHTVRLPAACATLEERVLTLRTEPWSPAAFGGADPRVLGIRVDWVVFQPVEEETGRP